MVENDTQNQIDYAKQWRRLLAFLIDIIPFWFVLSLLSVFVIEPVMLLTESESVNNNQLQEHIERIPIYIYGMYGILALWTTYLIASHLFYGKTLGKKLLGIKLIRTKNRDSNIFSIIIRETPFILLLVNTYLAMLAGISKPAYEAGLTIPVLDIKPVITVLGFVLILLWIGISIISVLVTRKRNRTLHDLLAGTVVIRSK